MRVYWAGMGVGQMMMTNLCMLIFVCFDISQY